MLLYICIYISGSRVGHSHLREFNFSLYLRLRVLVNFSNSHMTLLLGVLSPFSHMTFMAFQTIFRSVGFAIAFFSRAHMDPLPQSGAQRHLPFAELIRFLFLIVNELNRRINAETDFEIISDTSEIPPPPPPAASSSHRPRAQRVIVVSSANFAVQPAVVERPITVTIRVGHTVIIGRWNLNRYA